MTTAVTVRGTAYPVVLPSLRDPRLHVAAVIITVHVLGQVGLGFRVSVPQILAAILTCAILEIVITFRQTRSFVWPASAMLTGSGVALILRVVGTPAGDHWTTYAWWLYAAVAGLSLLSKYVIKTSKGHVFNPSNIGLVVTFVLLGTTRVEPLDFWWAPLEVPMLLAYAVILGGGLAITRRLHLLPLAAAFWVTLALGVGLLAATGHCMVATWSFAPVCGADFARTILTSPEVMVFLFFMITDPRTVPAGKVGRVVFGVLVGIASTLLMAPQTDEFGTKVGLLAGLVALCALRPILDRLVPQAKTSADDLGSWLRGLATGGKPSPAPARRVGAVVAAALLVVALGASVVLAGTPARGVVVPDATELLNAEVGSIDASTLPPITVGQDVIDFDHLLAGPEMQAVVVTMAQNLEVENQALLRRDGSLLPQVDHGDRLAEMQAKIAAAGSGAPVQIAHYRFASIHATLLQPFGRQDGLSIGLQSTGTVTQETYDASGHLTASANTPFSLTFVVRPVFGARWLNVAVLPASS
jgi:hypothetical protein